MEAAIVFGRAALHRIEAQFKGQRDWPEWWRSLLEDPAVVFMRHHRDVILKEAPFRVGQVVRMGVRETRAIDSYYFEEFDIPATHTIASHVERIAELVVIAEQKFGARAKAT